jgi:hypothetical protein
MMHTTIRRVPSLRQLSAFLSTPSSHTELELELELPHLQHADRLAARLDIASELQHRAYTPPTSAVAAQSRAFDSVVSPCVAIDLTRLYNVSVTSRQATTP